MTLHRTEVSIWWPKIHAFAIFGQSHRAGVQGLPSNSEQAFSGFPFLEALPSIVNVVSIYMFNYNGITYVN